MRAILLRLRTAKGVTVILIDTPSQSVRSSFQLAEPQPIRVSVASLRNMSGERKYHASAFNPEESLKRLLQGAAIGGVATIIVGFYWGGWSLGSTTLQDCKRAVRAGGHSGAGTGVRRQIPRTA